MITKIWDGKIDWQMSQAEIKKIVLEDLKMVIDQKLEKEIFIKNLENLFIQKKAFITMLLQEIAFLQGMEKINIKILKNLLRKYPIFQLGIKNKSYFKILYFSDENKKILKYLLKKDLNFLICNNDDPQKMISNIWLYNLQKKDCPPKARQGTIYIHFFCSSQKIEVEKQKIIIKVTKNNILGKLD